MPITKCLINRFYNDLSRSARWTDIWQGNNCD